jgi:hypothetical protein
MPDNDLPPLNSREYLHFVNAKFGPAYLATKFHISERTVQRWTADEKYVGEESVRKNPIEKIEETMRDMTERGYWREAQALVKRWAHMVGLTVEVVRDVPVSLADSLEEELLDTYPALCRFHRSVRDGDDLEIAEHWLEQARRELDEDFAAYCREWPTGGRDNVSHSMRQSRGK